MKPKDIRRRFESKFGEDLEDIQVVEEKAGVSEKSNYEVWVTVEKDLLRDAIELLTEVEAYPHITVISGVESEDSIDLIYHLSVGFGDSFGEVMVNIRITAQKPELKVPTITDMIPGSLSTEREMHEFMGIDFEGIPDSSHLFLPDDMDIHPWRKDEPEVESYVKRLDEQP